MLLTRFYLTQILQSFHHAVLREHMKNQDLEAGGTVWLGQKQVKDRNHKNIDMKSRSKIYQAFRK